MRRRHAYVRVPSTAYIRRLADAFLRRHRIVGRRELPHDCYRDRPIIFDLALPPIAYHDATEPAEFHRLIGEARAAGPVAMGPYGPELLTYDLVRSVLRDSRFVIPPGIGLVVQGITSGPVWDRVCKLLISLNGAEHQRLRRLVARAFTPRAAERMRAACVDVITELVDAQAPAGHCDVVTDIARPYPVPIICALLGAPREDWQLFSGGQTISLGPSDALSPRTSRRSWRRGNNSSPISRS